MVEAKKEPKKRLFREEMTVKDLIKVGLTPQDLQKVGEDWSIMIKLLNAMLISGPKITSSIGIKELTKLQEKVGNAFLD